jgi:hypothetical protein
MTPPDPRPQPAPAPADGSGQASESVSPTQQPSTPRGRPEQAREDTDAAWGEYPDSGDERLDRDRPPHWSNF